MSEKHKDDALAKREPMAVGGRPQGGIVPRNLEELWRLAKMISASGLAPKGMDRPETVAVAVTMGLEVGLSPMQAVQNIAVINGRPAIWGDAALALVRASGLCESHTETPVLDDAGNVVGYRVVTVRKGAQPVEHTFTVQDAKRAGLWGKAGAWKGYPQRMLQMRARSWALRDAYPDVLQGLAIREEAQDIPAEPAPAEVVGVEIEQAEQSLTARLKAQAEKLSQAPRAAIADAEGNDTPTEEIAQPAAEEADSVAVDEESVTMMDPGYTGDLFEFGEEE